MGTQVPNSTTLTKRRIHSLLIERGYSFRSWAQEKGFQPRTVRATVQRWAGKGKNPQGNTAQEIFLELDQTLASEAGES